MNKAYQHLKSAKCNTAIKPKALTINIMSNAPGNKQNSHCKQLEVHYSTRNGYFQSFLKLQKYCSMEQSAPAIIYLLSE